jgi:hypothetical protein
VWDRVSDSGPAERSSARSVLEVIKMQTPAELRSTWPGLRPCPTQSVLTTWVTYCVSTLSLLRGLQ